MNDEINLLLTILYHDTLLKVALKCKREDLPGECAQDPMEPVYRRALHALLPLHVQTCGPIVAVEDLFEITNQTGWAARDAEGVEFDCN